MVYDGAITKNEPGKVNIHPVTYKLAGLDISANVYTPANYDPAKKTPAVAVAHPNGGVKEQTAGLYGQRLAEQGYVTIVADAAFQGASGGQPRCVDKPAYRTEDIHGMADFIAQYPGVDAARLALFGICGGGGYALNAAKTDKRFKGVATLSMFNSGRVRRNGYGDSLLDTVQQRLEQASAARAVEAVGGDVLYAGDANLTDEQIAALPFDLYREDSYFDTAVNGFLIEASGIDIRELPAIGIVAESSCQFFSAASFPDTAYAGLAVERLGRSSVVYQIALFRNDEETPCALGRFVHVYVDRLTRRPMAIPEAIRNVVEDLTR